ncbi:MAG: hypothetical protein AB1782_10720 [Cyanobacteriota bacterium]
MEHTREIIAKTLTLFGSLLLITVFACFVDIINVSVNSFTGTSCVISAFAG